MDHSNIVFVFAEPLSYGLDDLKEKLQRTCTVVREAKVEHPVVKLGVVVLLPAQVKNHVVILVIEPEKGCNVIAVISPDLFHLLARNAHCNDSISDIG